MQVYFFDHTKICFVCGHAVTRCTCNRAHLRPCHCNAAGLSGGYLDCLDCKGRGWVEKEVIDNANQNET